jgi:hypothetical protein
MPVIHPERVAVLNGGLGIFAVLEILLRAVEKLVTLDFWVALAPRQHKHAKQRQDPFIETHRNLHEDNFTAETQRSLRPQPKFGVRKLACALIRCSLLRRLMPRAKQDSRDEGGNKL